MKKRNSSQSKRLDILLQLDYLNKIYPQSTYEQKAKVLGVSVSTVHKWINLYQNDDGVFDPYMADKLISSNIRKRGRRSKFNVKVDRALITLIRDYGISIDNIVTNIIIYIANGQDSLLFEEVPINERVKRNILTEQIKTLAEHNITSKQTFYNWINEGKTTVQVSELSLQRKRNKKAEITGLNSMKHQNNGSAKHLPPLPKDFDSEADYDCDYDHEFEYFS